MKKKEKKTALLARLASSLKLFYPEYSDQFLCPTCLRPYPIRDRHQIAEAHIVPQSAGGKIATLACATCNNTFGHLQDKWLGEFIRLTVAKESFFHTRHQKGHFNIGGQRVGGRFQVAADGGLEFLIFTDRTSPKALAEVQRLAAAGQLSEVTLPLPLLENRRLMSYGFLTSAYLLWFRELGYSFALQEHLGVVREAILNPETAALPNCMVTASQVFPEPWIGVGTVAGELCLITGLANRLVFLPPADRPDLYSRLPTDFSDVVMSDYQVLRFYTQHQFGGPLGVIYHNRIIVSPDILLKGATPPQFWLFPPDGGSPKMLYPVSEEEFRRQEMQPNTVKLKLRERIVIPITETGRKR